MKSTMYLPLNFPTRTRKLPNGVISGMTRRMFKGGAEYFLSATA